MSTRHIASVLIPVVLTSLVGCAKINQYASWPMTSSVDAVAIVQNQLLQGTVKLLPDRTGSVALSAPKGPVTDCMGALRFTGTTAGAIDLRCSDGSVTELQFALLSEARGYAYGLTAVGPVSLTFGLPSAEARAYLKIPPNRKLVEVGKDKTLDLQ